MHARHTSSSHGHQRRGKKVLSYAEQNYFSQRHKFWRTFFVSKPRLPAAIDESRWIGRKFIPLSYRNMIGKHNDEICKVLSRISDGFEDNPIIHNKTIVFGPGGSGKSTICELFFRSISSAIGISQQSSHKWICKVDCRTPDLSRVWQKINGFVNHEEKSLPIPYRIIFMDNVDEVPPSGQQILKKIMEKNHEIIKFFFTCTSPQKLIGFIQNHAFVLQTHKMREKDAVEFVLKICRSEKIGFERDGIQELFLTHQDTNISAILDMLQDVFVNTHFVSLENVLRRKQLEKGIIKKIEITPSAAVEPLERCEICTLVPPCQHITLEMLAEAGLERRKELPRYKGGMVCPEFLNKGRCTMFNHYGHCSLDHDGSKHVVVAPPARCPQCTLLWPCRHCAFSENRELVVRVAADIRDRLARLDKYTLPHPSKALVSMLLEKDPKYESILAQVKPIYFENLDKEAALSAVEEWLATTLCIEGPVYMSKEAILRRHYDGLLACDVLIDPNVVVKKKKGDDQYVFDEDEDA